MTQKIPANKVRLTLNLMNTLYKHKSQRRAGVLLDFLCVSLFICDHKSNHSRGTSCRILVASYTNSLLYTCNCALTWRMSRFFWKEVWSVLRKVERNTGQEEDSLKVENEPRRKDPPRTQFSWFHRLPFTAGSAPPQYWLSVGTLCWYLQHINTGKWVRAESGNF